MAGKRKRPDNAEEGEETTINGDNSAQQQQQQRFHDWLEDVLVILRTQDTSPSTFDRAISSTSRTTHDSKRIKPDETPENTTIGTLIDQRAYNSINEVVKDVETATAGIIHEFQDALDGDQRGQVSKTAYTSICRCAALERSFDKLIQTELVRQPETLIISDMIKEEPSDEEDTTVKLTKSDDNILTLLSSNNPPKQLFSSLRKPYDSSQPLDHVPLPNGITTTKVTPQHSINDESQKSVPTLKDIFPPPSSIPPHTLPKQSRHTATRSSSVNWFNPAESDSKSRSGRRDGYTGQGLSTGQWLKYSVAPSPSQLVSPETKRKQRDRALSVGEPQIALSQEAIETHNQAKEDALFRSVYSSFAPSRDDSGALVPEWQKDKLWWKKHGETIYHEILGARDNDMIEMEPAEINEVSEEDSLHVEELQEAIANWQPEEDSLEMQTPRGPKNAPPATEEEAQQLLDEISDLLETLHSHQRIRNLTIVNNARPMTGQAPQATTTAGSPTSPSSTEFDIYDLLKSQLTLIVSTLPPYLLSKLDGDKLGALQVSTNVQVESRNQRGVLEESEASAAARRAATPSATPAVQTSNTYPSIPGRSNSYLQASTPANQYPRSGYPLPSAQKASATSSYLQNPQYSNRPASSTYSSTTPRPAYPAQAGYASQTAAAPSAPRYNYAQHYAQQSSQASYGSYPNGYRPYSGQNANNYSYGGHPSTTQARTPSTNAQATAQTYQGTPSHYPQRAVPPQGYGYGSAQGGGNASPHSQHRPPYPSQPSNHQRPPLHHQHSSSQYQTQTQTPGSPQVNGNNSAASPAPAGHLNAEEQAAAISRQKAQLAGQQSRQGSGTPQPGSRQYTPQQEGAQQNGTPVAQQNGIAAGPA